MASKGEYKAVADEEEGRLPSRSASISSVASLGMREKGPWDSIANSPALPIAAYCVASILMTVTNKYVVSGSAFNMNFLLLTIQSVVCVGCVAICKQLGIISYGAFDPDAAKKWFPISFLLVCVIYSGSKALQYLPIQIYTIFKNLTIVLIAYGEVLYFPGSSITPLTLVSFGLMILSACVAASSDVMEAITGEVLSAKPTSHSTMGYFWMAMNCFVSAAFVLSMRKRIKLTGFSDWETLVYNNLLSIPPLIIFSFVFEDWSHESLVKNFPEESRYALLSLIAFSGAAAVGISFATAWVIRTTSSTTFSMVGALNKLPVAASGLLFFGDPATFTSVTSIILGFLAGLVYSAAKSAQKKQSAATAPR